MMATKPEPNISNVLRAFDSVEGLPTKKRGHIKVRLDPVLHAKLHVVKSFHGIRIEQIFHEALTLWFEQKKTKRE